MADFGDLAGKANEFLQSDKGEQVSDAALGKADDAIDQRTGGRFGDQLDQAEQAADDHIGQ